MLVVLPLSKQIFARARHQERLHELFGHGDVEKLARLHLVAELDEPVLFAEGDVGERADGQLDGRVVGAFHLTEGFDTERFDLGERLFGARGVGLVQRSLRCHCDCLTTR